MDQDFPEIVDYETYIDEKKEELEDSFSANPRYTENRNIRVLSIDDYIETLDGFTVDLIIIDDDIDDLVLISELALKTNIPKSIIAFDSDRSVVKLLGKNVDFEGLITLDFDLSGSGNYAPTAALYKKIKENWSDSLVIGLTNYESIPEVQKLNDDIRGNQDSVFDKNIFLSDRILPSLFSNYFGIIQNHQRLQNKLKESQKELREHKIITKYSSFIKPELIQKVKKPEYFTAHDIVGDSTAMRLLYLKINKLSRLNDNVWIYGETGTGKESVARAIHYHSNRSKKQLIVVNCSSIEKERAESELLGHEKGAFTGAHALHNGFLKQADGGTLFLDEIQALSLEVQDKLLRAIEYKSFFRVGGKEEIESDFRLIVATNSELEKEVELGSIKKDFFFRIANSIKIEVPPLRDRQEDIISIAEKLLWELSRDPNYGMDFSLSEGVKRKLVELKFEGNVRQLISTINRSAINAYLNDTQIIELHHLEYDELNRKVDSQPVIGQDRLEKVKPKLDEIENAIKKEIKKVGLNKKVTSTTLAKYLGFDRGYISQLFNTHYSSEIKQLLSTPIGQQRWPHLIEQINDFGLIRNWKGEL